MKPLDDWDLTFFCTARNCRPPQSLGRTQGIYELGTEGPMHGIFYLIGLIVVVLAILNLVF